MKGTILVVLSGMLLATSTAGAATRRLGLLGESANAFTQLGAQRGYYEAPPGTLRFVDVRDGTTRATALPPGCSEHGVSFPVVLLACGETPSYELLDVDRATTSPVDTSDCDTQPYAYGLGEIGRHWIAGLAYGGVRRDGTERNYPLFLNRRSGECKIYADESWGWRDLDKPGLPTRHPPSCDDRGARYDVHTPRGRDDRTYLDPCRGGRRIVLCQVGCYQVRVSTSAVIWVVGNRVRAHVFRTRRRYSWRLPGVANDSVSPVVLHNRLYVSILGDDASPPWEIYTASIPGARP